MKPIQIVGAKMALPTSTWAALVENALMVSLAAGLTYATQHIGKEDFGAYTPLVVAVASVVLGYIQKVLNNPIVPTPTPTPAPVPAPVIPPSPAPSPNNNTNSDHDFPIG